MSTQIGRERTLEKALKEVSADYDFCLHRHAAEPRPADDQRADRRRHKVIVPVQCEYLSMRGLVQLQNTLKMIQENLEPRCSISRASCRRCWTRGPSTPRRRWRSSRRTSATSFSSSRIRKAINFAEAPVKGSSVLKYDSETKRGEATTGISAKEVLANGLA